MSLLALTTFAVGSVRSIRDTILCASSGLPANAALQAGWNARVEDNRFVSAGHGFTLSADAVGPDGRQLTGVFVERRIEGGEEIITSQRGRLVSGASISSKRIRWRSPESAIVSPSIT